MLRQRPAAEANEPLIMFGRLETSSPVQRVEGQRPAGSCSARFRKPHGYGQEAGRAGVPRSGMCPPQGLIEMTRCRGFGAAEGGVAPLESHTAPRTPRRPCRRSSASSRRARDPDGLPPQLRALPGQLPRASLFKRKPMRQLGRRDRESEGRRLLESRVPAAAPSLRAGRDVLGLDPRMDGVREGRASDSRSVTTAVREAVGLVPVREGSQAALTPVPHQSPESAAL